MSATSEPRQGMHATLAALRKAAEGIIGKGVGTFFNVIAPSTVGNSLDASDRSAQRSFNRVLINLLTRQYQNGNNNNSTSPDPFRINPYDH